MSELNQDAERAAPEYARVREEFELATKLGARFDIDSAMLNVDALLNATRAAPVGEVELPAPAGGRGWIGSVDDYTQFHVLLNSVCDASEELEKAEGREVFAAADKLEKAKDALIACIDGRTAGAAPEGYVLVPATATSEMLESVVPDNTANLMYWRYTYGAIYAALIAAAPSPQHGKEGE